MATKSNEVLLEKLDNLALRMEEGFSGVHKRQDTTNGKVLKNATDVNQLKVDQVQIFANLSNFLEKVNDRKQQEKELEKDLDVAMKEVEANSDHRKLVQENWKNLKWIIGTLGIGNAILVAQAIIKALS